MDYLKILKRSWEILWRYRALWLFGILLALTVSGGVGSGSNFNYQFGSHDIDTYHFDNGWLNGMQQGWNDLGDYIGLILAGVMTLVCLSVIAGVVFTFLRYIANTSLIRMVNRYEEADERCTVKQGFKLGWSKASWRIFLIDLVINIPFAIGVSVLLVITMLPMLLWMTDNSAAGIVGTVISIGLFLLCLLVIVLLSAIIRILSQFFYRAAALQDLGVFDAIRAGYKLARKNLMDSILIWLILLVVQIVYGIATALLGIVLFFIILPLGALPGFITAGIASFFGSGPLPWITGLIVALFFIFFFLSLPFLFLGGLKQVFLSTVWTLTFRQFQGSGNPSVSPEPSTDNTEIEEVPSDGAEEHAIPEDEDLQ